MRNSRDSQRSKVYAIEMKAFKASPHPNPYPIDFDGPRQVQGYVNKITKSKLWRQDLAGRQFVRVEVVTRNNQHARGWMDHITIPPWAMTKHVVLHEMAHSILIYHTLSRLAFHGPEFVGVLRRFLEEYMDADSRRAFDHAAESMGGIKSGWLDFT